MGNRILIIILIVTATLGYAVYQSLQLDKKLAGQVVLEKNSVLSTLPNVKLKMYNENKVVSLNDVASNVNTIVHFWATWCAPCEKEFPALLTLAEKFKDKDNLKFVFVSVGDNLKSIDKFLSKYGKGTKNITLLLDETNISQRDFGTYKLPETFLFSKDLTLIKKFSGAQKWDSDYFLELFQGLK